MPDVLEHQTSRQQQGERVREALPRDIGRGAMDRLEDRGIGADIGAGRHAEASNQACELIRENIAKQIRRHDDIELPGVHHQLHRASVDNPIVRLDPALEFLGDDLTAF